VPTSLDPQALANWLTGRGAQGPLLLAALMVIAVVIGPIPTMPVSVASGMAFGVVGGTLVSVAGGLFGAGIAFWIARLGGRPLVQRLAGDHLLLHPGVSDWLLFWVVLVTRLVPLFSFALISYAAGLTAMSTSRFLLATLIGMLPMTLVYVGLGQTLHVHPLLTVISGGLIVALMITVPWYLQRYQGKRIRAWLDKQ